MLSLYVIMPTCLLAAVAFKVRRIQVKSDTTKDFCHTITKLLRI